MTNYSLVIYYILLFQMIDYLIFDPTKQFWTNLELCLTVMTFLIFRDFSRILIIRFDGRDASLIPICQENFIPIDKSI